jgi:uncharacterized protein (TIRG00374 family)
MQPEMIQDKPASRRDIASWKGHQTAVWIVVGVVVAAGIATVLITVVPRLRCLASTRIRPHLVSIWANIKTIAAEPRKVFYVLAGSVLAQLFVAMVLGLSLHAVGQRTSIATLLVVITLASIIGGAIPVPGGLSVVEAGLIGGLTSAGVPQDQAVAAVFIQRLFTAYLPPIWGWATSPGCADANTCDVARAGSAVRMGARKAYGRPLFHRIKGHSAV